MIATERNMPLILVADDDITVRMIARECLQESGYAVEEAENGSEAVELCARIHPDAVMLDVLMPGMGGFEACRRIRAVPGNENLPILMMTALEDVESINAAYEAGATEFTGKPVNWTIESHRLRGMLRVAEAARQIYISKQEWERTFNALDELVIVYDTDMIIVQANNAAIAAAQNPMSSVRGKSCHSVFGSSQSKCEECPIQQALRRGEKAAIEWDCDCFGGTFLISIFPVLDTEGNLARSVCLAKDITERKRMDEELRCAQKMDAIGTLSGGLAHDFNNLLQIVIGYSEMCLQEVPAGEGLSGHLAAIRDAARRGGDITRQLMAVGRNVESRPTQMMLNQVVQEVATLLSRTFPKNITIELNLDEDLGWVHADPAQMEQVIMNLAVNARHAMPEGGGLYLETRNVELDHDYCRMHPNVKPGKYVMFSVTDTGCGIDAETQARIFEPFFTTRSSEEGTGLGLAMVYGIIKKHNGHTLCYSEVGEGTTLKIYIPILIGEEESREPDSAEQQQLSVGGDEVILLVDDEPEIRNLAKKMLLRAGYRVILAGNGQEALSTLAIEGGMIDFVVLDLNMPIMGGLECLDRLRERGSGVPVLLASGFALNEESRKRLDDTVHYLNKPYHSTELLKEIRSMLNARA